MAQLPIASHSAIPHVALQSPTCQATLERRFMTDRETVQVSEAAAARRVGAMVALHDALAAGDASRVDAWLGMGLGNARFNGGRTALMLAATHPDEQAAVKMVDVALKHGAELHASDDCKRDVLMHACLRGAHASVIQRIMQRNEERGGWQLAWWHRDREGLDAVALASRGGHGKLAAHLLDHALDLVARPLENYPLKVLEIALQAGNEACALDVLKSTTMQRAVRLKAEQVELTRNPWQDNCTVYSCVDAAVKHNLASALDAMLALNHVDVARATWYSLHRLEASKSLLEDDGTAAHVLLDVRRIGRQYRSGRVWSSVRVPVLLRHRGLELQLRSGASVSSSCAEEDPSWRLVSLLSLPLAALRGALGSSSDRSGSMLAMYLATLPDPVFRLVANYLVPLASDELQQIRFWLDARRCRRCERLCIPGECRQEAAM